jgi:hypothetical protein
MISKRLVMLFIVVLSENLKGNLHQHQHWKCTTKNYKQNHENHKNITLNFSLQKPNMFMYQKKKKFVENTYMNNNN